MWWRLQTLSETVGWRSLSHQEQRTGLYTSFGEGHLQGGWKIPESKLELPFGVPGWLIEQQKKGIPEEVVSVNAVSIPTASNLVVTHRVCKLLVRTARARELTAHDLESQPIVNAEPEFSVVEV